MYPWSFEVNVKPVNAMCRLIGELVKPLLLGPTDAITFLIQLPCNTALIYAFQINLINLMLTYSLVQMFQLHEQQQVEQLIINALVFFCLFKPNYAIEDSLCET